jgi:hypothetical protein
MFLIVSTAADDDFYDFRHQFVLFQESRRYDEYECGGNAKFIVRT